ncbi:hypothetical protein HDE_13948 [Halotydeus destructor]|nr:hypothetical protein HDE_13948 [Halotydeus destructor]
MIALRLIAAISLIAAAQCIVSWNCGSENSPLTSKFADIKPNPVQYPGNVSIDSTLVSTAVLPATNFYVKMLLQKVAPTPLHIPCFLGYGSCEYDFCGKTVPNNQAAFCSMGLCKCPFEAKEYVGKNIPYQLPNFGGLISKIVVGDYTGNVTFFNKVDGTVYGCVGMNFTIVKNSGSHFMI